MKQLTRIHRFHDRIALLLRGYDTHGNAVESETTYLSADEAGELGRALIDFVDDVESVEFTGSHAAERTVEIKRFCAPR